MTLSFQFSLKRQAVITSFNPGELNVIEITYQKNNYECKKTRDIRSYLKNRIFNLIN